MHPSSMKNMQRFARMYLAGFEAADLAIADIGSMDVNGSYRPLFTSPSWQYTGVDMAPGNNVDVVLAELYQWRELATASFDVVVSGQAFEHIEYFWETMREVARILRPGGLCCLIAPSSGFEHRYPVDCWRFYPDGMRALARYVGMDTLEAYAQWDPETWPHRDPVWQDCVLVARKPGTKSPLAGAPAAHGASSRPDLAHYWVRALPPDAASDLLLRCHLDLPSDGQASELDASGLLGIRGWVLGRHWQPERLCVRCVDSGTVLRYPIDRERGDVVQKILQQEPRGHPKLRCGFDVRVPTSASLEIGFEVAGNVVVRYALERKHGLTPQ